MSAAAHQTTEVPEDLVAAIASAGVIPVQAYCDLRGRCSVATAYRDMDSGAVQWVKLGRRRYIVASSAHRYIASNVRSGPLG